MSFSAKIVALLSRHDYIPLPSDSLARALDAEDGHARDAFNRELSQLLKSGKVLRIKGDRIILPEEADLVAGIIRFKGKSGALLFPDAPEGSPPGTRVEPFQIRSEDTHTAFHGDKVVARKEYHTAKKAASHPTFVKKGKKGRHAAKAVAEARSSSDLPYAKVIRILERGNPTLTGTLQKSRLYFYVVPDDPRIQHDILVPDPARTALRPHPKVGDKVVVKIAEWEQRHLNPQGEVIEVLGQSHTPMAEYKAILHQYELSPDFPPAVIDEVRSLPRQVPESDIQGRMDLRSLDVFTIDPDDAKDFDDALHIEKTEEGHWRVGIHIADVSFYVRQGTALDKEAARRGNSTYLVGTVIPMLPHALSNGLCSLVEAENRLTKSVFITYTPQGKPIKTEFANTVISSRKRLTYRQAYCLLNEKSLDKIRAFPLPPAHQTGSIGRPLSSLSDDELLTLQKDIRALWSIAKKLRSTRMSKGSLDLDMPEHKIFVDEKGWADRIEKIEYDESHQLIEEFMLSANEAVAFALTKAGLPAIHRVHEKPEEEKLNEFRQYIDGFGIKVGDLSLKPEIRKVLSAIKDHPQGYHLRTQFLRSLKQACYRATPDGHYGLSKKFYAHFTSPIRRYADLIVHRVFQHYMEKHGYTKTSLNTGYAYPPERLEELAHHISATEQNSTDAERESVKVKLMEFFERELAKPDKTAFEAVVTDVRNFGFFVELTQSQAFGLVHLSNIKGDFYELSGDGKTLIGRKRKTRISIGQVLKVSIYKIDRFKRQMDFVLAGE